MAFRLDRAVVQHQERVERGRHQRGDAHQRQARGRLDVQLRLVGHRHFGLARGHQLGRIVGVGRLDQLDLQAGVAEIALLERHH
jgi:hypothetical protein